MRMATPKDIGALVDLMSEFYEEANFSLDRRRATDAFAAFVADPRLGWIWLVEKDAEIVGYLVVTVCFSMEYGGAGLGTKTLAEARDYCGSRGVRGIAVETGYDNSAAQKVYRRVGFAETNRQLLRLGIANPLHVGR